MVLDRLKLRNSEEYTKSILEKKVILDFVNCRPFFNDTMLANKKEDFYIAKVFKDKTSINVIYPIKNKDYSGGHSQAWDDDNDHYYVASKKFLDSHPYKKYKSWNVPISSILSIEEGTKQMEFNFNE